MAQHVPFLTTEADEEDLIVSFALDEHALDNLTLLRTPQNESLLPEDEIGVTVSSSKESNGASEFLVSLDWGLTSVKITSTAHEYTLDISDVDEQEIEEAKGVLMKMNFDQRFELNIV
jgi:hypothetical protein